MHLAPKSMPTSSPLSAGAGWYVVIPGFLSPQECREHIALSEARGFAGAASHYPPSYRDNDRQVVDDAALADRMAGRLAADAPMRLQRDGAQWSFDGINERFRFCRYRPGQQFRIHQDGVHHRAPGRQSWLTFMIYLTDGDAFVGGDTVFYSAGPAGDAPGVPAREIGRVRPRAGSLILFDHSLWHAGETVVHGVKHILRSDVLYRREGCTEPAPSGPFSPGHQGYVWTMARLERQVLASGGRDTLIRLWNNDGAPLGQLAGHRQSVLGLAALPGGRLASISRDGSLRLWNVPERRCVGVVPAHRGSGLCVVALRDGTLATGGADGEVRHWRADGTPISTLGNHAGWVWAIAETGDGQLASASEDGAVRLWDLASMRCEAVLPAGAPLRDLVATDAGGLFSADIEGRIITWTRAKGSWQRETTTQAHRAAVRRLRLLGSGLMASAGEDHCVRVWSLRDGTLMAESRHDNFATDVLRVPTGYLSCAYDGRIVAQALPH